MSKTNKETWKEKVVRFCTKLTNLIITVFFEEVKEEDEE